jgi:hypothetical protein
VSFRLQLWQKGTQFSSDPEVLSAAMFPTLIGEFTHGHALAVDSKGNVYVAETDWGRGPKIQANEMMLPRANNDYLAFLAKLFDSHLAPLSPE